MFLKMTTQLIFPLPIYYKYIIQRTFAESLRKYPNDNIWNDINVKTHIIY